jgi:hypothetical protein
MMSFQKLGTRIGAPCALFVAACLMSSPARADELTDRTGSEGQLGPAAQDEARRRFARGLDLYREADYTAALSEFRRAYALIPNYKLLYNIGQVCYQLQNYACALPAFEQYLSEGGAEVPSARRSAVESDIDKLRTRVARITIHSNVRGATISIDDVPVGKTPLEAVVVSVGTRRITATADGKPPLVRSISVAGEETATVDFDFTDSGRAKAEASSSGTPARVSHGSVPSWPFWAATAGLAVGAGISGFMALRANSDLEQQRNTFGITPQELSKTEQRASTMALAADLLTGAAVVCGGVALYTTLTSRKRLDGPQSGSGSPGSTLDVAVGPANIRIRGSF